MTSHIPASIITEHRELHMRLAQATQERGLLGERARELARQLEPHFRKEERYALPPLAILAKLAWTGPTQDMADMVGVTRRLTAELPVMLLEHKDIVAAVERFRSAAQDAERPDCERLADALILHARHEEEVLYPAAVLVGSYLELKLQPPCAVQPQFA